MSKKLNSDAAGIPGTDNMDGDRSVPALLMEQFDRLMALVRHLIFRRATRNISKTNAQADAEEPHGWNPYGDDD